MHDGSNDDCGRKEEGGVASRKCGKCAGPRETGQPSLTRERNLSSANGDRVNSALPVHLITSRIGNDTMLMLNILNENDDHTHSLDLIPIGIGTDHIAFYTE